MRTFQVLRAYRESVRAAGAFGGQAEHIKSDLHRQTKKLKDKEHL